jgi:23S rRNA U2552 (ribose-2'-O)-methylase RlmE/FtsJ
MMGRIGEEMNASTGAFNLSNTTPTVLDFCAAPGGFVKYALQINPGAKVNALTLPEQLGGLRLRIPYEPWNPRVSMEYTDVTMFAEEFGLPDILKNPESGTNLALSWPYKVDRYDLVICDGQAIRQNQVEGDYLTPLRLTYSQLYIGLKRVTSGGTMIILMHRSSRVRTFRLIRMFC